MLFAIVVEGLNRFATLAPATALLILAAALAAGSFLGLRFAAARLLLLSLGGVVVSSLLAGFPRVVFPAVGLLLLAAGVVATIADRRGLARGLKWWMALLALVFWALWAFKLQMTWRHGPALAPYFQEAVHSLREMPHVVDIRNWGMVAAIELEPRPGRPAERAFSVFLRCYEKDLLIRTTGDIIALSPPLIISRQQMDELVGTLGAALRELGRQ